MYSSKISNLLRLGGKIDGQLYNNVRHLSREELLKDIAPVSPLPEYAKLEKTINQVFLLGRVGTEPQKKGTDENPVVVFSLATHSTVRHETGDYNQKTEWHRICVFKPSLRELVSNFLKKGQRIHISGRLTYSSTKEDNNYRPTSSIIADDIIFFQTYEAAQK